MENEMDTMSAVLSALHAEGFTKDFSFSAGQAGQADNLLRRFPEKFVIIRSYRFEEDTNPENEAVIYAVASDELGVKGYVVNGYGIYSDPAIDQLIGKLSTRNSSGL